MKILNVNPNLNILKPLLKTWDKVKTNNVGLMYTKIINEGACVVHSIEHKHLSLVWPNTFKLNLIVDESAFGRNMFYKENPTHNDVNLIIQAIKNINSV